MLDVMQIKHESKLQFNLRTKRMLGATEFKLNKKLLEYVSRSPLKKRVYTEKLKKR